MRVPSVFMVMAVGLAVGGGSFAATVSGASAARHGSRQRLVNRVLTQVAPGARGSIRDGTTLRIILPPGSGGPSQPQRNDTRVWRASLAADELALRLPGLRQWTIPRNQTNSLADVRHPAGAPDLDSLSLSAARRQLAANLRVLAAGLPASAHLRIHTSTIALSLVHRRFAFSVDLSVRRLSALRRYFGDLLLGPGTGLTEGGYLIEGQAVVVHDAHGHLVGAWGTARGQSAIDYGPGNSCLQVTLPFRDRHGRPPPSACHG